MNQKNDPLRKNIAMLRCTGLFSKQLFSGWAFLQLMMQSILKKQTPTIMKPKN